MALSRESKVFINLYRENMKNFYLSETTRPRALIFGMKHHLVDFYQVCSNDVWPRCRGHIGLYKINFFSEYGHVAYQIKGNEAYNKMLAKTIPLNTPLTPGWGQKVICLF